MRGRVFKKKYKKATAEKANITRKLTILTSNVKYTNVKYICSKYYDDVKLLFVQWIKTKEPTASSGLCNYRILNGV